ncbi:4Fe-4S binding protein [Bacillus sp. ISL-35]|uniref:4Fe-4S binding protein n=1 Tax=Bacillus sp. ISL-35 TaxID=2819122 RepID=UPI001BE96084|nr:4Fe-4S binding protein [Bacillus sp. ISL-35]MBT2681439.1 4Fe-4S binding protein [Bacillus sp. ISL-35]MBT2701906.1 4Fe-4S binding protein [Chryseobacterium sp. ISL-80]
MSLVGNWIESLSYELEISSSCTRKISHMSSCSACMDECPTEAISVENGELNISKQSCTTCGVCITVCPVQAIKGQSPPRRIIQNHILLGDGSALPTVAELLYYHKKGIRRVYEPLVSEELMENVKQANDILAKIEFEPLSIVNKVELDREDQPRISRRAFFAKLTSDSKKTVLSSMTPIKWRFNENSFKTSNLFKGWSFYQVKLNQEDCTLCEACFAICPSEVFRLVDDSLKLTDHNCSGCRLCSDICKENSVQIFYKVHKSEEESRPVVKTNCQKCHTPFHSWSARELCPICSSVEKPNFFL